MGDLLLSISKNPQGRKLLSTVGVPVPPRLVRAKGPWKEPALKGLGITIGGNGALHGAFADALPPAGAKLNIYGRDTAEYAGQAEAFGCELESVAAGEAGPRAHGLVFDATGVAHPDDLKEVYEFFHLNIRQVRKGGRVIVLGRPQVEQRSAAAAAAAQALEGFARTVAKEVGRKGATAQIVYVESGAEQRIGGLLRFLLSERSAYISGQRFDVTGLVAPPPAIPYTKPLENKVALVTGAARGIGAATAAILAREGAQVVCLDRPADDEPLSLTARRFGGHVLLQDLAEPDASRTIADHLLEKYQGVDIVIHNAGVTRDKTLAKMDHDRWQQVIDVNLKAVIGISDQLLQEGLRDGGRIVCLSSISGIAGNFGQTNYAATKAGVIGFVRHLAREVAERGITVNAVAPGFVETRMTAAMPLFTREVGRRLCNLSQGGLPQDIGEVITFLASASSYGLTGAVIRVCGGNLLGA
jgi:3-oxoacyl-[acyl-carrier protein] reductase